MSAHYSAERIRRGVINLLGGKVLSSIAGFLSLLLAVRILSIESFAVYTVALATVELVMALTGLGLVHVALRFVPELMSQERFGALRKLIAIILGLRTAVLIVAVVVALVLFGDRSMQIGLLTNLDFLTPLGVLAILRPTGLFVSQILESMLHQGYAQGGLTLASLVRLAGLLILLLETSHSVESVLWVEVVADCAGFGVMMTGMLLVLKRSRKNVASGESASWLSENRRRLLKFASAGYLQMLTLLPAGNHTNRVLAGALLVPHATAVFGFGYALSDYLRRYLPGNLLVGVIRPVILSRFSISGHYVDAVRVANLVCVVNWLVLGAGASVVIVAGPEAMKLLSSGKYGADSAWLFLAFLILIGLETVRQQLEVLAQAIERYELLIIPNLALSASIFLAVILAPHIDGLAFPVSGVAGLLIANKLITSRMAAIGFPYSYEWRSLWRISLGVVFSCFFGLFVKHADFPWPFAAGVSAATYLGIILVLLKDDLHGLLLMIKRRRTTDAPLVSKEEKP